MGTPRAYGLKFIIQSFVRELMMMEVIDNLSFVCDWDSYQHLRFSENH